MIIVVIITVTVTISVTKREWKDQEIPGLPKRNQTNLALSRRTV